MKLETIYKKAKTGAVMQYDISVTGDTITTLSGQVGGAMTPNDTVCEPKNVGRSNESTGAEQAILEAKAKHAKKIKSGYTLDPSGEISVKLPMKVKMYQDQKKNVIFPCYASPKLNGVNGEYRLAEDDTLTLHTRGGDEYPMIEHHKDEIVQLLKNIGTDAINGEIYIHGEHLQDLTGAVKKFKDHITPRLEFRSFDLPNFDGGYATRQKALSNHDRNTIEAVMLYTHEEIEEYHTKCVEDGYEGIVIRNISGAYTYNERSSDAFKFKIALDAEYQVVGYKLDKSKHAVFECTTGSHTFSVKLKGTATERLAMAAEADKYIGEWLKLEYETLSKDGKPLKPVGLHFRKCDADGNPLE